MIEFLTDENEFKLNDSIQILYFYINTSFYHKKMLLMFNSLDFNTKIIAIDAENFKNQCIRFDIKCAPTVIVLNNGKELKRVSGLINFNILNKILKCDI